MHKECFSLSSTSLIPKEPQKPGLKVLGGGKPEADPDPSVGSPILVLCQNHFSETELHVQ